MACVDGHVLPNVTSNTIWESQNWKFEHYWKRNGDAGDSFKCFCGRGGYENWRWTDCQIVCDCDYRSMGMRTCDLKTKCKCVDDDYAGGPQCDRRVCRYTANNATRLLCRGYWAEDCDGYVSWNRTIDDFDECTCGRGRKIDSGECDCGDDFKGILCERRTYRLPTDEPWVPPTDEPYRTRYRPDRYTPYRPRPVPYRDPTTESSKQPDGALIGLGVGLSVILVLCCVFPFIYVFCCQKDDKKPKKKKQLDEMILAAALDEAGNPLPTYEYGTPAFPFKQPPGSPPIFVLSPPITIDTPPKIAVDSFGPPRSSIHSGGTSASLKTAASARDLKSSSKSSIRTSSAKAKAKSKLKAPGSNVVKKILPKKV